MTLDYFYQFRCVYYKVLHSLSKADLGPDGGGGQGWICRSQSKIKASVAWGDSIAGW